MGSSRKNAETRQMTVRYAETSPATITEFGCSGCRWTFLIEHPAPGPVRAELLEFAEKAYDLHGCPERGVPAECAAGAKNGAATSLEDPEVVN